MKISITFILFALMSTLLMAEKRIDSILASVNGEPISLLDVLLESGKEEARLAMIYSGQNLQHEVKKVRTLVLDDIIERKLIYADFKKKKFKIPQQYIQDMLGNLAFEMSDGSIEGLREKSKKFGVTMEELREKAIEKVAVDMMINGYCYRDVNITPKQIYEYYIEHKRNFQTDDRLRLQLLFIKNDKRSKDIISEITGELAKNPEKVPKETFNDLVKKYSVGINVANGGDVGWIDKSKVRPEFADALEKTSVGRVVGPVKTDEGFYFIRYADEEKSETVTFNDLQDKIKSRLEQTEKKKKLKAYIDKLKERAVIRSFLDPKRKNPVGDSFAKPEPHSQL